jgi:4-amino-4-deoxy-L-arabinose transferase-like glycosyltransferase
LAADRRLVADAPCGVTLKEAVQLDLPPVDGVEDVSPAPRDRGNALAIAILVAVPAIVFCAFDLFGGHLLLSGDNLLQNYPLRVLAGSDLRHGQLPLWDPFVWSGTPLLAGLNAGAFYPLSLLFAVASSPVAWVIGQVFVFSSVGVGTYLLFRSGGTSVLASFLGAFSFTFAGAVASQTAVHLDMGDGLASLPWALLAVRRIGEDGRWRWALLLGAAFALSVLAGSPEAVLDTAALCLTFAVLMWWSRRGKLRIYTSRIAVGAVLAIGVTAFVWMPALRFIAHSQRPGGGEYFASEFSFPPYSGILVLVPYLEGGYSLFSQPSYFGQSNLEEVAVYVGILPLIATVALLTRSWRNRIPKGELLCWYGVLVVGIVLAVGAGSPLEHLLYQLPFYGKQRDSGRNIVEFDLAACALLAWWVDGGNRPERASGSSRLRRADKVTALIPLVVVALVGVFFAVSPRELWHVLRAVPPAGVGAVGSGPAILLAGGLAGAGAILALLRSRVGATWWARAVSIFVVVDVGLFVLGTGYASAQQPPEATRLSPVLGLVKANLSPGGRYAVFDPDLFDSSESPDAGEPDLGVLNGLPSISGYGSIADGRYAAQTLTQMRGFINIASLGEGKYQTLGLQVMVTVPESFIVPIAGLPKVGGGSFKVLAEQPGTDPALPGGNSPPALPPLLSLGIAPARQEIPSAATSGWWFGTTLSLGSADVQLGDPAQGQVVRAGVISAGGVSWGNPTRIGVGATTAHLALAERTGEGIELQVLSGPPLQSARMVVATEGGRYYLAGGVLSNAMQPGQWTQLGIADDFVVFRAGYTPKAAWLQAAGTASAVPSPSMALSNTDARVVDSSADETTIETTTQNPALLVWSSAWDPGWTAEMVDGGGDRSLRVERAGLVEAVNVPAGSSEIRFSYRPADFALGLLLSAVTVAGLVVVCAVAFTVRRRRANASLGLAGGDGAAGASPR